MQLITDDPECFDTFLAHYGKFKNARNYIAIVGRKDLPTLEERKEIFKVHLTRRLKDPEVCAEIKPDENLINQLAQMTEGFIGSEIEQAVIAALCDAFFENRGLKFSDFEKAIQNTVPLSTTQREQILAIREWANVRAVCASSKKNIESYNTDETSTDVNASRGGRRLDV